MNINLVPTAGPLLQTCASLCINPTGPSYNVSMWVLFNWRCDDNANDDAVAKGGKLWKEVPSLENVEG